MQIFIYKVYIYLYWFKTCISMYITKHNLYSNLFTLNILYV
jgi:hypothetical protein